MNAAFRAAAKSDVGLKRANNEDAFGVFPEAGVFCVADGMGGGDDGEVASATVVREIGRMAEKAATAPNGLQGTVAAIRDAANVASDWICRRTKRERLVSCGSTLVALCLDPANPRAAVALHAGDSRLYRIRGRQIEQVTRDHSPAALAGASDESAVNPMFRGVILRAVGLQPEVELEVTPLELKPGDRLILCSDGLSRVVPDMRILEVALRNGAPEDAAEALVAAANAAGGDDNVTVVVVDLPRRRRWPLVAFMAACMAAASAALCLALARPEQRPLPPTPDYTAAPEDALRARSAAEAATRLAEQCAIEKGGRYLDAAFRRLNLVMPKTLGAHIDQMGDPGLSDEARRDLAVALTADLQTAMADVAARSDDADFRAKVAELLHGAPSEPRTQRLAANLLLMISTKGP